MSNLSWQNRRRKQRYSTFALAWVWLVFLAVSLLVVSLVVAARTNEMRNQVTRRGIDQALGLATSFYRNHIDYAEFLANELLAQETFLAQVKTSDPNLVRTLQLRPAEQGVEIFMGVWNAQQRLLAQSDSDVTADYPPETLARDLTQGLNGQGGHRIELGDSGTGHSVLITPIQEPGSREPLGVLIIGFHLDTIFSRQALELNETQQLLLVSDGQYVMSTFSGPDGAPLPGKPAAAPVLAAIRSNSGESVISPDGGQDSFVFKFKPLESTHNSVSLGIGTRVMMLPELAQMFLSDFGLPFLGVFLIMGTVGLVYAHRWDGSVQSLRNSLQELYRGDLATPIPIVRSDELGDLAGEMERIRASFAANLEQARSELASLRQVIDTMHAAIITTDSNQRIVSMNPAAETLLHENKADVVGQPWVALLVGDGNLAPGAFGWKLDATQAASVTPAEMSIISRASLRKRPLSKVEIVSTPIINGESIRGFVHVLYDATSHEQDLREKDEFLLNASHELRSPLAKLRAANELIVEAYDEKNWAQIGALLGNMQRTVIRFQVFVENLIDIGSVQAGRFYVRPRRVDYNRIVADALGEFRPSIAMRANGVELCSTIPEPCYIMGDPQRLVQVFFNLLTNALKYGGEDSAIQVSVHVDNGAVYTQVTDHGPGIPEEEIPQIFQRYYRGKSVESEGMGIGLGLAIAREIIEQHGGEINVKSDKSEGTCFWFRLPLVNAVQEEQQK